MRLERGQFPDIDVIAGRGYATKVLIKQGALILQESPWFCLCDGQFDVPDEYTQSQKWLELQDAPCEDTTFNHGEDYDKFRTNAMPCGTLTRPDSGEDAKATGIFFIASFFNSSCTPNVTAHWIQHEHRMEFRAVRDIYPQEELCIVYDVYALLDKREIRQDKIYEAYGFVCACPVCEQSDLEAKVSDDRRESIRATIRKREPDVTDVSNRH